MTIDPLLLVYIVGMVPFAGIGGTSELWSERLLIPLLWPLLGLPALYLVCKRTYEKTYLRKFPYKFPFRPRLWGWLDYSAADRRQMVVGIRTSRDYDAIERFLVTIGSFDVPYDKMIPGLKLPPGISSYDFRGVFRSEPAQLAARLALDNGLAVDDSIRVEVEREKLIRERQEQETQTEYRGWWIFKVARRRLGERTWNAAMQQKLQRLLREQEIPLATAWNGGVLESKYVFVDRERGKVGDVAWEDAAAAEKREAARLQKDHETWSKKKHLVPV